MRGIQCLAFSLGLRVWSDPFWSIFRWVDSWFASERILVRLGVLAHEILQMVFKVSGFWGLIQVKHTVYTKQTKFHKLESNSKPNITKTHYYLYTPRNPCFFWHFFGPQKRPNQLKRPRRLRRSRPRTWTTSFRVSSARPDEAGGVGEAGGVVKGKIVWGSCWVLGRKVP